MFDEQIGFRTQSICQTVNHIHTMLNFDGDGHRHGNETSMCKQAFNSGLRDKAHQLVILGVH